MSIDDRIAYLQDRANRRRLDEMARSAGPLRGLADWANLTVHATFKPENKHLEGRTIGDIAADQNKSPFDTMLDLAISEGLRTAFMPPAVGGDTALWKVRGQLWQDERTVIGASDAGAHLDMIDTFAFSTQVLGNGVREFKAIELEQAIHQLTQVPAELFGLRERGLLRTGWHADIVVFDPKTVGFGSGAHASRPAVQRTAHLRRCIRRRSRVRERRADHPRRQAHERASRHGAALGQRHVHAGNGMANPSVAAR